MIVPDRGFIKALSRLGGNSCNKCFQCGTCSVVCPLSPDEGPFPRKEMIWAQWGLKDRLLRDPDIWLCHGCSDCSSSCPRGANPGDVMAALRSYAITHWAVPSFWGRLFSRLGGLPILVAVPAILLLAYLIATGKFIFPPGEIVFTRYFPLPVLFGIVLLIGGFVLSVVIGAWRFWQNLGGFNNNPSPAVARGKGNRLQGTQSQQHPWTVFVSVLGEIFKHTRFTQCGVNKSRFYVHLGILYGFILIMVAHLGGAVYPLFGREESGVPIYDPIKVIGNLGALLLVAGCAAVIYRRLARREKTTYYDWYFLLVLLAVGISGLLAQAFRYFGLVMGAYPLFLVHLTLNFMLLAYLPYSKFAHLVYRTLAMTYARQIGRERG